MSGTCHNTQWQSFDELALKFEGLNLDAVYESLARQIAGGRLGVGGDIEEAVFRDSSFASSPEKINVFEIFKLLAPNTNVRVM